jgi:anti-sigma regulatory factor (Ser/Thr protein kinase)
LASLSQVREFVRQHALAAGLDKKQIYKLGLAVDEIATNAISHGYEQSETSGELVLAAETDAAKLSILLEDTAPPFDPTAEAEPDNLDQPLEQRKAGGLGVFLTLKNVDEFAYHYANGRNCYTFTMYRPASISTEEVAVILGTWPRLNVFRKRRLSLKKATRAPNCTRSYPVKSGYMMVARRWLNWARERFSARWRLSTPNRGAPR